MKQKFISTLALVVFSGFFLFFNSGCQKEASQNLPEINNPDKDKIIAWLDQKKLSSKKKETAIIQSVKDNLDFSKLRYEELRDGEKLIIVPLKTNFKSLNNAGKNPINIILFVLDKTKNIRKGDIIQYIPANSQVKSVPINTFYNFFNFKTIEGDAKMTFLNISDEFLYEYNIKDGKILNYAVLKNKGKDKARLVCTNWYMVFTWADGSEDWQYLYTVCEDVPCELNRIMNGLNFRNNCDGGGGGGGGEQESAGTTVSRQIELVVWREITYPENWKMFGIFTVTGKSFSNSSNNSFTNISHDISGCWYYNAVTAAWPQSSDYSIFTELNHSSGLINPTTASGRVEAQMFYPNLPQTYGGPQYKYYQKGETWQASVALY